MLITRPPPCGEDNGGGNKNVSSGERMKKETEGLLDDDGTEGISWEQRSKCRGMDERSGNDDGPLRRPEPEF